MASPAAILSENTNGFNIERTVPGTKLVVLFTVQFKPIGSQAIAFVRAGEGVDFIPISIVDLPPSTSSSKQAEVLAAFKENAIAYFQGKVHFLPNPIALYKKWRAELANPESSPQQQSLQNSINHINFDVKTLESLLLLERDSNRPTKLSPTHWLIEGLKRWGMLPSKEVVDRLEKRRLLQAKALVFRELGLKYGELSCLQAALVCHQNSLNLAIEINDRKLESAAYGNLGNAYYDLGESRLCTK